MKLHFYFLVNKNINEILLLISLFIGLTQCNNAYSEDQSDYIGYKSVEQAREDLTSDSRLLISEQQGWLIISDKTNHLLWSFVPSTHAAYPAVVKRRVVKKDDKVFISMKVLCEASKPACDQLVEEFNKLNNRIKESHLKSSD